ncbi:MAG: hypothetical protein AAGF04_04395 [Chlamydiota bacterium]
MKHFWSMACFLLIAVGGNLLWHALTGGFSPQKILRSGAFSSRKTCSLPACLREETWRYLGKGRQAYVFASGDGSHVLKFFRHHRTGGGIFSFLGRFLSFDQRPCSFSRNSWLTSHEYALEVLGEKSGLLLLQGSSYERGGCVTIADALGRVHRVDLSGTHFVLQKRARILGDALEEACASGNQCAFLHWVERYFFWQIALVERGIVNRDPCPLRNTGLSKEGELFEIDLGRYQLLDQEEIYSIFPTSVKTLDAYVQRRCPGWQEAYLAKKKAYADTLIQLDKDRFSDPGP